MDTKKPSKSQKPWFMQPYVLLGAGAAVIIVATLVGWNIFFPPSGGGSKRAIGQDFKTEMGDPNAPVVVYEYSDFQCPACSYFAREHKPKLEEKHINTGNVRLVYRNFIVKGEKSVLAAEAAYCAAEQGAFWRYHDTLFEKHDRGVDFTKANFLRFARELGLQEDSFQSCLDSRKYRDRVWEDHREGEQRGVDATPSFFVNGRLVRGADYLAILEAIKQNLPPGR